MCLVVNHANQHEQRRLEHGVRQGVHRSSGQSEGGANTNGGNNPTKVGHRRISSELFQVGLLDSE